MGIRPNVFFKGLPSRIPVWQIRIRNLIRWIRGFHINRVRSGMSFSKLKRRISMLTALAPKGIFHRLTINWPKQLLCGVPGGYDFGCQ